MTVLLAILSRKSRLRWLCPVANGADQLSSACGHGGIGRRATLRSLWAKARGSSSLLGRTRQSRPILRTGIFLLIGHNPAQFSGFAAQAQQRQDCRFLPIFNPAAIRGAVVRTTRGAVPTVNIHPNLLIIYGYVESARIYPGGLIGAHLQIGPHNKAKNTGSARYSHIAAITSLVECQR